MSEIEIGEYVRTKKGRIGKLIDIDLRNNAYYLDCKSCVSLGNIKNHKEKLLDLIEVGDYVNGYKILEIADSIYPNSKRVLIYKNEKEKYERWIYIQEYDGKIHT